MFQMFFLIERQINFIEFSKSKIAYTNTNTIKEFWKVFFFNAKKFVSQSELCCVYRKDIQTHFACLANQSIDSFDHRFDSSHLYAHANCAEKYTFIVFPNTCKWTLILYRRDITTQRHWPMFTRWLKMLVTKNPILEYTTNCWLPTNCSASEYF